MGHYTEGTQQGVHNGKKKLSFLQNYLDNSLFNKLQNSIPVIFTFELEEYRDINVLLYSQLNSNGICSGGFDSLIAIEDSLISLKREIDLDTFRTGVDANSLIFLSKRQSPIKVTDNIIIKAPTTTPRQKYKKDASFLFISSSPCKQSNETDNSVLTVSHKEIQTPYYNQDKPLILSYPYYTVGYGGYINVSIE